MIIMIITLDDALKTEKITKHEYNGYVTWAVSQHGVEYLKYLRDALFMEEPNLDKENHSSLSELALLLQGRKMLVNDFINQVKKVNLILEGKDNERDPRTSGSYDTRNYSRD